MIEHILASNLTKHLNKHNTLYDLQHGFRQNKSCEAQLIQLVEDLGRQLIQGKQTGLVLLDFSKAFDKISPKIYFLNSPNIGLKIRTLLLGRTQGVVLDGESSSDVPVTSGVPYGSVLGPLLFLLYINGLPQNIQSQVLDSKLAQEDANTLQADFDTLQE